MLGLCCDETYSAMTNHDEIDEGRDNNGNEYVNNNNNAASGSGSDGKSSI